MERLTYFDGGKWRLKIGDTEYSGEAVDRLAAYEGTGLEPEEILSAVDMAKIACALHELNAYKELGSIDCLRKLAQADREGRCVVLPCKAGETVYLITAPENVSGIDLEDLTDEECEHNRIFECKVSSMTICDNGAHIQVRLHFNGQFVAHYITPEDFGKVVFLSCADAGAALRREQDEKGGGSE